jgi:hypothetical protein
MSQEDVMKKYGAFLLTFIFAFSIAAIVYAGHEHMVIPYEAQALGYKTTMPIPSGGDLRHHLVGHQPYKKWKTWPGKGEMYKGTEPHGSLLTTYVNDIALKSIKKQQGMKNNSIIVKENYAPNKKLVAVTAMYKVKGYNADNGDWFWVKYDAEFNVLKEGKVKGCLACHGTVKDNDFIFTGKVK